MLERRLDGELLPKKRAEVGARSGGGSNRREETRREDSSDGGMNDDRQNASDGHKKS
jgi:hypothetical protein